MGRDSESSRGVKGCDDTPPQRGRAVASGVDDSCSRGGVKGKGNTPPQSNRLGDSGSLQRGRAVTSGVGDSGSGCGVKGGGDTPSQKSRAVASGVDDSGYGSECGDGSGCDDLLLQMDRLGDSGARGSAKNSLEQALRERTVVLDGAIGTMIQAMNLSESDYRGSRFAEWSVPLRGCCDILTLSNPSIIKDLHRQYLEAGADIITTNTLLSNASSLSDRCLSDYAYEMNRRAAIVAREAIDEFVEGRSFADGVGSATPPQRYVAGVVGPIKATALPLHSKKERDDSVDELFEAMVEVYRVQISGLLDGGVDAILIETIIDAHSAMAAVEALRIETLRSGVRVPFMLSATLTMNGILHSGETVEEFYKLFATAKPLSIGINCSYGVAHIAPYLARLREVAKCYLSVHPNAGLPDSSGLYDSPALFATQMGELIDFDAVDILGGCCGTTPAHIAKLVELVKGR